VIHLTSPYGAFANVLAFPSAGLVPSGTPMRNLSNDPPPGVGPYQITDVAPNRHFSLVKNTRFAALKIPGIPVKIFGVSLATAVFLDAFVVRSLLLPAVLELLGRWTWKLPGWLDRRLPRVPMEPQAEAMSSSGPSPPAS
jgi:hypothetical protein